MAYTIQRCVKCGKDVKIEALDFLVSLDSDVVCKSCKKEEVKKENVAKRDEFRGEGIC